MPRTNLSRALMGTRNFRRGTGCQVAASIGYTAAADQAVNVWVQVRRWDPRVQHGRHGHGAADITGIAGEFGGSCPALYCIGHGIAVSLMSTHAPRATRRAR